MASPTETAALREYVATLQRQNQAKSTEQQTLYRELQALAEEVSSMEKYYHQSRAYRQQIAALEDKVAALEAQLAEKQAGEQQWRFLVSQNEDLGERVRCFQARIEELQASCQAKDSEIAQLGEQRKRLQASISELSARQRAEAEEWREVSALLEEKEDELLQLRGRVAELSREDLSRNIQEVVRNYEKIAEVVLEKEEAIRELEAYIGELEQQCQALNEDCVRSGRHARQLEQELRAMRSRKSQQLSEDGLSFLTDSVSKIALIRQNNRMLEQITHFQKENRFEGNQQQRALSECAQPHLSSSRSKLHMRIQALKTENQSLLRTLAI